MIKRISFLARKDGMPVADFRRHWRDIHAPILLAMPKVLKYAVTFFDEGDAPCAADGTSFDGFATLHFASSSDMDEAYASPAGQAAAADMANFAGRVNRIVIDELVLIDAEKKLV